MNDIKQSFNQNTKRSCDSSCMLLTSKESLGVESNYEIPCTCFLSELFKVHSMVCRRKVKISLLVRGEGVIFVFKVYRKTQTH